jgi:hypothetical protein
MNRSAGLEERHGTGGGDEDDGGSEMLDTRRRIKEKWHRPSNLSKQFRIFAANYCS